MLNRLKRFLMWGNYECLCERHKGYWRTGPKETWNRCVDCNGLVGKIHSAPKDCIDTFLSVVTNNSELHVFRQCRMCQSAVPANDEEAIQYVNDRRAWEWVCSMVDFYVATVPHLVHLHETAKVVASKRALLEGRKDVRAMGGYFR